ncbi:hypothetical protein H0H87_010886 [Tephrocybe sp. NHM501043]|nr:hypothetical protein H0H87_010886 [Tephrocybe sp. NHM501043]
MSNIPDQIRTDRARILVFMKRKEGITHEEFSTYWRGTHAKLFMSLNIAHTDINWVTVPQTAMGLTAPDWDGILILEGENFEKLFAVSSEDIIHKVFGSEEYQRVVGSDEENFLDRPKCQLLPVGFVTIVE